MSLPSGWFYTITTEIDHFIQVISMQVKFYASLRQAAGTKMTDVEVSTGTSVRDVLVEVTHRYPSLDKFIWKDQGELSEHAHVFVNGENIRRLDGLDTAIKPDDHVDIFPPLVGG
jgi:molybdopterin synthase sulfur carrier subunit